MCRPNDHPDKVLGENMNVNRKDVLQICLVNGLFVFFVYKPEEPYFTISERLYEAMAAKLIAGPAENMTWFSGDPMVMTQNPADVITCLKNPFTSRIFPSAQIVERGEKYVSVIGPGETAHFYNYYRIVTVD
jgi:hypothetical protein